jgi:predicted permease
MPIRIMGLDQVGVSVRLVVVSLGLSLVGGVLCAIGPALKVARGRLAADLSGARTVSPLAASRGRTWLVAVEMALAVPLLVGSGLLVQTLINVQRVRLGFEPDGVLYFQTALAGPRYATEAAQRAFHRQLADRLAAIPGVAATGLSLAMPFLGINDTGGTVTTENDPTQSAKAFFSAYRITSAGYFAAMRIPIERGRLFTDTDRDTVVVNARFATTAWGNADPIGRHLHAGYSDSAPPWLTVIGVVGDTRDGSLTSEPDPELFVPYASSVQRSMFVVVRASGDALALWPAIRESARDVDPRVPLASANTMRSIVDEGLARTRFGTICASLFGGLGLILAATGTFAVLSVLVSARTREIGVRVALGARPDQIRRMVLRQSMLPALVGCGAGMGIAIALAKAMASLVYQVAPRDPQTVVVSAGALGLVALAASWWPARRAMRLDPVRALRAQ